LSDRVHPRAAPALHRALPHDSARLHVTGAARYVDDLPEPARTLQVHIAWADRAHADILAMGLAAVGAAPGVVTVLTGHEVPGINEISTVHVDDEPLLATDKVMYWGQPLFVVAADDIKAARRAAKLARIEYRDLYPVLDVDTARAREDFVLPPFRMARGDPRAALDAAPHRLQARLRIGGQDHFYLEGQVAMAIPGEGGDMLVLSSTQHPSEVQHMVARVLGVPDAAVTVECRRMGGGFGGKESQANLPACVAALVAAATGRPAKCRMDRDDDMIVTGKRHDFLVDYDVAFDADGAIRAVDMAFASRCGWSADLSGPINDRALFHADNGYFYPHVALVAYPCRTNTVSNTAFRGFGGPQGMVAAERVIEEVAFATGLDPLDVRKRNLYGPAPRDVTPYHMALDDNVLPELIERLAMTSDYRARREVIRRFNATSPWLRKGLALTPVKFGISFTFTAYNQAGALVHIYKDGSVHLNHGGTEMGQGLHVKVAQVVADELALPLDRIRITATTTGKVPNTSATAASSGSDLNGMAAQAAARTLKERLVAFVAERHQADLAEVRWLPGAVQVKGDAIPFGRLVKEAYFARVQLSATGFYRTPEISWDRAAGRGRPFFYFAYGAACAEVTVDTLTGESVVDRVDILHDVGKALNPAVDLGQIEGGFVQGMGWLTGEELWWDAQGRLRTHAPSTYKIPCCSDRPKDLRIELWDRPNRKPTIGRSKAVGEPPLMLAIAVLMALSDAVASVAGHRVCPRLDPPATPERILSAVERMREAAGR
jgi:xanthine dehydrogenase large subunit